MKRHTLTPRSNWQAQVEGLGFDFHTPLGNTYWDESACYAFTAAEIDALEEATNELESMCMAAVGHIIDKNLFGQMRIPPMAVSMIVQSWKQQERNVYGRFDLAYDGHNIKLLEYNADTPTSLLEAAVVQWQWLESVMPGKDQFNSIHERLIGAWARMGVQGPIYFACSEESPEDVGTTVYMQDTAAQAGLETHFIAMGDIGADEARFYDLEERPVSNLFKLYPWEWLWAEPFAALLQPSGMRVIEPAWKMLLSNKALLAVLWEMYPKHPYLLEASFDENAIKGNVVKKPFFGREGSNVTLQGPEGLVSTPGIYGAEGFVYQEYMHIPDFSGNIPIIGSWIVASESAGIGIREDRSRITQDTARFIPHYFE